jgi:hypothetical protein
MHEEYTKAAGDILEVLAELRPRRLEIARPVAEEPAVAISRSVPTPEAATQGSAGLRLAGALTGGVGLASLVGAGYYASRVVSLSDESRNAAVFDSGRTDNLDSAETRQYVFLTAGLVALATGAVLYYFGTK